MHNPPNQGGLVVYRETTQDKSELSCGTCPASICHSNFTPINTIQEHCQLLNGMVYGSFINTRNLVREILAKNPEIQCPAIASANRLITTVERVIDQALSQQLKDLEAKAKEEAAKAGATSAPSDSTEAAVAVPTNLDEQATVASTPTGEEAAQS